MKLSMRHTSGGLGPTVHASRRYSRLYIRAYMTGASIPVDKLGATTPLNRAAEPAEIADEE